MKSRRLLLPVLSAVSIAASSGFLHAQTITWNLAGGGSWNSPASWDPAALPSAADGVVFNQTAATAVTLDDNQTAKSLTVTNTAGIATVLTGGGTNRTLIVSGPTTLTSGNFTVGSTTAGQNVSLTATTIAKSGTGNLELGNANTIGDIAHAQGNIHTRNATALGSATSGTITLGSAEGNFNAQLRMASATYAAKPIVLGPSTGVLTIDTLGASNPIAAFPITGTNNLRITNTNSGTMTYNTGPINHTGNLTLRNLFATTTTGTTGRTTINAPIGANVANVTVGRDAGVNAASFIVISNSNNAYTGNTTIDAGATLQLGNSEVIPHGEGNGNLIINGNGALNLRTTTGDSVETVNGLTGGSDAIIRRSGSAGNSTLIIGAGDADGLFEGQFEETAGRISVIKTGLGAMVFGEAVSGHTGDTTIQGGTLTILGEAFLPGGSFIDIASAATLNLEYEGVTDAASFRINGIAQATGLWGRIGSIAALGAQFETPRITGNGLIRSLNSAGELYWDGSSTSWAAIAAWSLSPDAITPDPTNIPNADFAAIFGGTTVTTPQTVNLNTSASTSGLRFITAQPFTVLGGGSDRTLAIGSKGIVVGQDALAPVIGSTLAGQKVAVTLLESQTWTQNSITEPLVVHNDINGPSADFTLTGSGPTTLNGGISGLFSLNLSGSGNAELNGLIEVFDSLNINKPVDTLIAGRIAGNASLVKTGTGALTLEGENTFSGEKLVNQGGIVLAGDQSASNGGWVLRGYGATGTTFNTAATTVTIAEDAEVAIAAGKTVQVGNSAPAGGFAAQTIQSSGSVTNEGTLSLGRSGTLNVNAGTWTQSGPAIVATQGGGLATVNVLTGGTLAFTHTAAPFALRTSTSNNTRTKLNINGGTFTTGQPVHNSTTTLTTGTFAEIILGNAGKLALTADIADLLTSAGAGIRFEVAAGNGTVDTAGFSTTLNVPIEGAGGLVKAGTGTFATTAPHTYSGNTRVSGGTLTLAHPSLSGTATVTIDTGATLKLDFVGENTIAGLTIGNLPPLITGTYDKATHPGFIDGDGKLTVVPVVEASFASWAEDLGLSGNPDADFDNDGLADAVEFVLGTDPKSANPSAIQSEDLGDSLVLRFNRDDASETADLTLTVEAGANLSAWPEVFTIRETTALSSNGVTVVENGDAPDAITVTIPKNDRTSLFARLKVLVSGN